MKKILCLTMIFAVAFACIACSDKSAGIDDTGNNQEGSSNLVEFPDVYNVYKAEDAVIEEASAYCLIFQMGEGGHYRLGEISELNSYYKKGEQIALPLARVQPFPPGPDGVYEFDKWVSSNGGTFDDAVNPQFFFMPANDTTITATFRNVEGMYRLTIEANKYGIWIVNTNYFKEGERIKLISGNRFFPPNPDTVYKEFNKWTSSNGGEFGNAQKLDTYFTMPGNDTTLTATFK